LSRAAPRGEPRSDHTIRTLAARAAVLLSFRLGGTDGVSVEATKWATALHDLGFGVRRVAGELPGASEPGDILLPWLARDPGPDALLDDSALRTALGRADLVVAANLCSLPLNLPASRCAARVLGRHTGHVLFHHHDLPWQREGFEHITDLPPNPDRALHVTINDRSRHELARRGIKAVTIRNAFDVDTASGNRGLTRATFGIAEREVVLLQPTRAIPRKNVAAAVRFAAAVQELMPKQPVRLWISGPAEDGYDETFAEIMRRAPVETAVGRTERAVDAYAACDAVVLPSSWEGFGNPVIESVVARRPVAVASYPVLEEIVSMGFRLFSIESPQELVSFLEDPDARLLEQNLAVARAHFSLADLPTRLEAAFRAVGWERFWINRGRMP
jgi:glycosyltransferase involved in cell wall biosynthesis